MLAELADALMLVALANVQMRGCLWNSQMC